MKKTIPTRLQALREELAHKGIDACIIPGTDPHLSEYVAPHWQARQWISGFTGSAGTVVVTANKAGLWTDSRYFLQAAAQLDGTGISLYKDMLPGTLSITEFLSKELHKGCRVGINGEVFATTLAEQTAGTLLKSEITLVNDFDPLPQIWVDRPPIPTGAPFIYKEEYAGKSCKDKIEEIREALRRKACDALLLSALDEIAWTLNLRGNDVKCNPVFISYLIITSSEVTCFIAPEKITDEIAGYLKRQGINIAGYDTIATCLRNLKEKSILLNPAQTNYKLYSSINPQTTIVRDNSPVALLKAIRNSREIAGVRHAMRKDGVAMVRFLIWLEKAAATSSETEWSIDKKLHAFRAGQPLYMGESFDTIAGYGPHGAIIHYSATPESAAIIHPKGFLLLDSGAQYLDGTTDITRTIVLGELTNEEKTDFTLVLKGVIALSMAQFPAGTRGTQLDVLARMPLWQHGMNYLYGTGHGVGHFLNVHEGPQSIRMNENPVILHPGMTISNEPGTYKTDKYGIRTENILLIVKAGEGMFGEYYKFETLTLCPIDKKGIMKEMLTTDELKWLNNYHRMVYERLADGLNEEEKEWLKEKCNEF